MLTQILGARLHTVTVNKPPVVSGQDSLVSGVGRVPLARNTDPATSHAAAAKADRFAASHVARILKSLADGAWMTAQDIAEETGLTVVQVDRRIAQMIREERVRVVVIDGAEASWGGFRLLEAI